MDSPHMHTAQWKYALPEFRKNIPLQEGMSRFEVGTIEVTQRVSEERRETPKKFQWCRKWSAHLQFSLFISRSLFHSFGSKPTHESAWNHPNILIDGNEYTWWDMRVYWEVDWIVYLYVSAFVCVCVWERNLSCSLAFAAVVNAITSLSRHNRLRPTVSTDNGVNKCISQTIARERENLLLAHEFSVFSFLHRFHSRSHILYRSPCVSHSLIGMRHIGLL